MPIGALATFTFRVLRRLSVLLEPTTAAASIPVRIVNCLEQPAYIEFTVTGSTALTGTITVTGELAGAPQSETVNVVGPVGGTGTALVRTCKRFDCITADLTTTGLADEVPAPTIRADLVGVDGASIHAVTELADCVLGHREERLSSWRARPPGPNEEGTDTIDYDDWYDFTPLKGDLWVEQRDGVDADTWEVVGNPRYNGDLMPHHWELRVKPANARSTAVVTP